MIDKLYLSKYSGTTIVSDMNYEKIAEVLNMNYTVNGTDHVYYKNDPNTGFSIYEQSTTEYRVYPYINGARSTTYVINFNPAFTTGRTILYYKNNTKNDSVVFGFGNETNPFILSIIVSPGTCIDTGEKKYAYSFQYSSNETFNPNLLVEGSLRIQNLSITSKILDNDFIVLKPLYSYIDKFVSDNVYIGEVFFLEIQQSMEFMMNNDTYYTLRRFSTSIPNMIFKV